MESHAEPDSSTHTPHTANGESQNIERSLKNYLLESFLLDDEEIGPDTSLINSGIVDSTGVLEIVAFIEETFGIEVDDEDLTAENLDSLSRLVQFVDARRGNHR